MSIHPSARSPFIQGMYDSIPIALGYFAVSFSLGIIAGKAGIPTLLGFTGSLCIRASAGEYGVYTLIAAQATYLEVIGMGIVTNLRYLLMSTALTQKLQLSAPLWKRLLAGLCMTDEIFGISIAYPGRVPTAYPIGATLIAGTFWASGTAFGILAGNNLPLSIVSALSVALYGMFIAIIIPPAKQNHIIALAVGISFLSSGLCSTTPYISQLSSGMRTIFLTLIISAIIAWFFPIRQEEEHPDVTSEENQ